MRGTVKWFNDERGYGFINPDEGGKDVFVHISALEKSGIGQIDEGDRLEFELKTQRNGKEAAENLKRVAA